MRILGLLAVLTLALTFMSRGLAFQDAAEPVRPPAAPSATEPEAIIEATASSLDDAIATIETEITVAPTLSPGPAPATDEPQDRITYEIEASDGGTVTYKVIGSSKHPRVPQRIIYKVGANGALEQPSYQYGSGSTDGWVGVLTTDGDTVTELRADSLLLEHRGTEQRPAAIATGDVVVQTAPTLPRPPQGSGVGYYFAPGVEYYVAPGVEYYSIPGAGRAPVDESTPGATPLPDRYRGPDVYRAPGVSPAPDSPDAGGTRRPRAARRPLPPGSERYTFVVPDAFYGGEGDTRPAPPRRSRAARPSPDRIRLQRPEGDGPVVIEYDPVTGTAHARAASGGGLEVELDALRQEVMELRREVEALKSRWNSDRGRGAPRARTRRGR